MLEQRRRRRVATIQPPTDGVEGSLLHRLAAPADRRPLRRRPGVRRRPEDPRRPSTPTSRPRPRRRSPAALGGLGPTSAVVVIENGTGKVLAMVGGQDFDERAFNLATNGQRQPGSSFKPFTLVTALKEGISPDDGLRVGAAADPLQGDDHEQERRARRRSRTTSSVSNYDDNYLGSASIATATTYSDNSVYAQLGIDVGINDIVDTAHDLGINSELDDNPAMILGGLENGVTPLEMAYAYNTLANDGDADQRHAGEPRQRQGPGRDRGDHGRRTTATASPSPTTPAPAARTRRPTSRSSTRRSPATATDILHTVVTSGTGKRAQVGDDYIWGKTGTTDNNADAWFVGANEDDHRRRLGRIRRRRDADADRVRRRCPVDGGTIPALIWNDVVTAWDTLAGHPRGRGGVRRARPIDGHRDADDRGRPGRADRDRRAGGVGGQRGRHARAEEPVGARRGAGAGRARRADTGGGVGAPA